MATLDLRQIAKLNIQVLLGKPWSFALDFTNGASLVGATITFKVLRAYGGVPVIDLSVGNGVTIVSNTRIAFEPQPLTVNDSHIDIEMTALTGEVYRIKGRISATND